MESRRIVSFAKTLRLAVGLAATLSIGAYGPPSHAGIVIEESVATKADAPAAADAKRSAAGTAAQGSNGPASTINRSALNPQPLPPKQAKVATEGSAAKAKLNNGALNPQPLPPKVVGGAAAAPGAAKMINPQPLPPKQGSLNWGAPSINNGSINPQPLPPDPPPTQQPGAVAR
jgi:hypothetical protein